jgi:hypothetical protein
MRDDWHSDSRAQHHRPPFGRFFGWPLKVTFCIFFVILFWRMKGRRKKKEREEVIASPRQRHLVFYTGRGGETVVFFFCYWVGCCCSSQQRKGKEVFKYGRRRWCYRSPFLFGTLNIFWVLRAVWARKNEKRATLNDDGQWSNGYFDTSSTYQEFLVGLATATHKLGPALAQLSMEFAIGPFIIPVGPPHSIYTQPQPLFHLDPAPSKHSTISSPRISTLARRLSSSTFTKHTTLKQPSPFTSYQSRYIAQGDDDVVKLSTLLLLFSVLPILFTYSHSLSLLSYFSANTITSSCRAVVYREYCTTLPNYNYYSRFPGMCINDGAIHLRTILMRQWWLTL